MKIAIISDLHLGYRQYGSLEREEDFYSQYLKCMRRIKENNPDLLIIAGDIFDKPNPSPKAMDVYRKGISLLNGIPIYAITGNHTMLMRDNHYTVDNYFAESGIENYHLIDDTLISYDDIQISGIIYRTDSDLESFKEALNDVTSQQGEREFYILVIHQAIKEYCGFTGAELSINDLKLDSYDLIICGHIHSPYFTEVNKGKTVFIQPGSIERMNTTEAADEIERGKGFVIFNTETNSTEFYEVESDRKFLLGDIEFNSLEDIENHFEKLQDTIQNLDLPPVVSYNYYDNTGSSPYIRECIKGLNGTLINNSNIYNLSEELPAVEITDNELPTVLEVIELKESDYLDDNSKKLAKDIFNSYNNTKEEENIGGILDSFFKKRYNHSDIVEDPEIKKIKKEIKEYEDFFNNLGES